MRVEHEMAGIGVPFAAGVAAGFPLCAFSVAAALPCLLQPLLLVGAAVLSRLPRHTLSRTGWGGVMAVLFFLTGIFCSVNARLLACCAPPENGPLAALSLRAVERLRTTILEIPYPEQGTGALVLALLTGERGALGRETVAVFRESGAAHILALSGLHLGLLYLVFSKLTLPMGKSLPARRLRGLLLVGAAGCYTLATGASASLVRAFLFILIGETARQLNREREALSVLAAALTLQLALRPEEILTPGFQLSYLAMTGITLLYPRLERLYPAAPGKPSPPGPLRRIWNAAALTLSCQAFTAPIAWVHFHTFPKYFLLTNLLALPLTGLMMVVSAGTVALWAAGCCPEGLVVLNDRVASLLVYCLEVIAGMGG